MASLSRRRRTPDLPTVGGVVAAGLVVAFVLLLPALRLQAAVTDLQLHALLPAAVLEPSARALLAASGATLAGAFTWAALFLLWGSGGFLAGSVDRARETPMLPERPWPDDLDQPLAAYDPAAIPAEPLQPVRALPSLLRPSGPQRFSALIEGLERAAAS